MADAVLMQMLDTFYDLVEEVGGYVVVHSIVLHYVVEELACVGVFHNKVEVGLSFDYLIQLNHSGVSDFLQDLDLPCNPIDVHLVLDLVLLQYLDGYLFIRDRVDSLFHLAEGSFSESAVY